MQGVFVHASRPKTKKALKEAVDHVGNPLNSDTENPLPDVHSSHKCDGYCIVVEATSMFGNEYDGSLARAPKHMRFYIAGPDPHTSRKWYAAIEYDNEANRWKVS